MNSIFSYKEYTIYAWIKVVKLTNVSVYRTEDVCIYALPASKHPLQ